MKRVANGLLAGLMVCLVVFPSMAALPFGVTPGHPRVYIDPARVDQIRVAATQPIPLSGSDFPHRGRLSFDFDPGTGASNNDGIFDAYSASRNHLFMRHYTPTSTPPSATAVGFQIAFQPVSNTYVTVCNFWMEPGQWHSIEISWDPDNFSNRVVIDQGAPICTSWKSDNGVPRPWQPDGQRFEFAGKGRIDNIRLYDQPLSGGNLLVDYDFDTDSGYVVTDQSGNARNARINAAVTRVPDAAAGQAIEMDGATALLRMIATDPLTEAWSDTLDIASGYATNLAANPAAYNVVNNSPYGIIQVARAVALAYLVTGDSAFLDASRTYGEQLACADPASGNDRAQAGRVEAMGVIYDWTFAASASLTVQCAGGPVTPLRSALADAIRANIIQREVQICGSGQTLVADASNNLSCSVWPPQASYISGHPHENNTYITAGLLAVIDERPDLEPVLAAEHENFVNGYNPARAWIAANGGHHMGFLTYGSLYAFLDSILMFETATDANMVDNWQGQLFYRFIHGLRGDLAYPASGDTTKNPSIGTINRHVVGFSLWAADYFSDPVARGFYEDWQLPFMTGLRFNELFLLQPNQPRSAIGQLPLARHFVNAGQVFARDTWDIPNATLLSFKSSSFWTENHHHLDQNAFTLFYKAPLLTESGFYDLYGTDQWNNYFTRSIAHNTLTVRDPSEQFFKKNDAQGNPVLLSNDGGQQFLKPLNPRTVDALQPGGTHHLDGVVAYEDNGDYVYMVGNASKAYAASKLDQSNGFVRSILYLRNPAFWGKPVSVIHDKVRVQPGQESLEKRVLFHTIDEPVERGGMARGPGVHVMTGDTFEIRNGNGMAYLQTLLPVNRTINLIGGDDGTTDYRFWVRDANGVYQDHPLVSQPGADYADLGQWRLEVIADDANPTEHFLNVLSVTDNIPNAPAPPAQTDLSNVDVAATLLGANQLVVFNKQDTALSSLSIDVPVDQPALLMAGLAPSTSYRANIVASNSALPYRLLLQQDAAGAYASSAQGVLDISGAIPVGQDLALAISANPPPVRAGDSVTYVITVTQNGPTQATGVTVTDVLPAGVTFDSVSTTRGVCTGTETVQCQIGVMNAGEVVTITLAATAGVSANITNSVSLASDQADPVAGNNTASVTTTHILAGDLAPRGNPDGVLNAADVLVLERIVAGLITPTADEQVAADVHPLGAGDGLFTPADVLMLQRAIDGDVVL